MHDQPSRRGSYAVSDLTGASPAARPAATEDCGAATLTSLAAENRQLRAELDLARSERARLLAARQEVLDVLGVADSHKLMHALRNILNERALYKALSEMDDVDDAPS